MTLDMENLELIVHKQQESIAILLEKLSMNMNFETEPSDPPEPKRTPESLIQQISESGPTFES